MKERAAFYFPERWLNNIEEREFYDRLLKTNWDGPLMRVDLLTISCVMITDFFNEEIKIIDGM